ncbi:hypothetical protein RB195_026162 [Necator americanus]|uniref:Uncharacterized protein n=1 Tax=Necator americanus TaxID=51031 RepID=A0ABR1EVX2_NECAM
MDTIHTTTIRQRMAISDDEDHDEFNLTKKNSAMLFSNELTALYTLLAILLIASLAYIIVKAVIHSRKNGFLSSGTKSEMTPIKGKSIVNAA